ncbi:MAG: thioredoxin family protein, partial [Pseudomonadota bacterium]
MRKPNPRRGPQSPACESDSPVTHRKPLFHVWRCFWLSFLAISIVYTAYCFYVPANKIAWAESYAAAQSRATDSDKPMILYFTGKWCVPCRIMKRQVWADPQVMTQVTHQFVPVLIDVNDPKNAAILERYNVKGSPVTIIADGS